MSGLLGPIPTRHLTARAQWWLKHCTVIMPNEYPADLPVQLAACLVARAGSLPNTVGGLIAIIKAKAIADHDGHQTKCIDGWSCGVVDVRAMYLSSYDPVITKAIKVRKVKTGTVGVTRRTPHANIVRWEWMMAPITMPTCMECMVILDDTLGSCVPKYGDYPTTVVDKALIGWKELSPPEKYEPQDPFRSALERMKE